MTAVLNYTSNIQIHNQVYIRIWLHTFTYQKPGGVVTHFTHKTICQSKQSWFTYSRMVMLKEITTFWCKKTNIRREINNTLKCVFSSSVTVAEDIGPHQLERLVELLTAHECEELISAISQPEESIFQHLDRLSAERNQLLHSRRRRNTGKYDRHESRCFK